MLASPSALLLASLAGPPALEWSAPEGCPTDADVQRSLAALTARADLDNVRARGVIRRAGNQYELRLDVHTGRLRQRRSLRADACDTLGEAAALLIAIVLDPVEVATQLAIEPAPRTPRDLAAAAVLAVPVPEKAPPAAPPARNRASPPLSAAPTTPPPPLRPPRDTSLLLRLEGALDAGNTPTLTGDVAGVLGLLHGPLRVELHGLYAVGQALLRRGDDRPVGALARWNLGARLCGRLVRSVLEIPLCAGLEARQFLATARPGFTVTATDRGPSWFAILLGVGAMWSPHPRVGIGARTEFAIAPYKVNFLVDPPVPGVTELAYQTDLLNIRFSLGVEVRFGPGARLAAAPAAKSPAPPRAPDGSAATRPQSR